MTSSSGLKFPRTGAIAAAAPHTLAPGTMKSSAEGVLLVVDVQNRFIPGGSLPVKDGDTIIPIIDRLSARVRSM